MRTPLIVSLFVHGAMGVALALLAVAREPAGPGLEIELAVREDQSAEVVRRPEDPAIPEPPYVAEPLEFPQDAPEPEPFEAAPEEPTPRPRLGTPARVTRLPTPLSRPVRAAPAPPAAPPAVARAAPKGEIRPPRLLADLSPDARYPARARRMNLEGTVMLLLAVAPDGTVGRIDVAASSGHEELDEAAKDAAARWRFEPARRNGIAIAYDVRVPVEFRLTD